MNRRIAHFLALTILLWLASGSDAATAQTVVRSVSGEYFSPATLDSIFAAAAAEADVPGLSVAIVNGDRTVYHGVFGVTNTRTGVPVDDSTVFEAASLSKPVFAYYALRQVEAGLLDLDTPLYRYLPHPGIVHRDREAATCITARMVLAHRSGFPNHANGDSIALAFPPGEGFAYSGEGYQYLAAVIAALRGTDLQDGLSQDFRRLAGTLFGWQHSSFVATPYLQRHLATGHTQEGAPTEASVGKTFLAYSSLHTEASEYARFLSTLLRREGLSADTYDEMLREQTGFAPEHPLRREIGQTGWGLAMAQKPTEYGMMHVHTGNNHDFQAYMMVLPEQDFGIVCFLNGPRAIPFLQAINRSIGPIL